MGRDELLLAEMELLIDGELDRGRRIGLLSRIAGDQKICAVLAEAIALDRDLSSLGAVYDAVEPRSDALPRLYAAIAASRPKSPISSVLSGLGAAAQKLLTPLDDARLAIIIAGGEAPPPTTDSERIANDADAPRRDGPSDRMPAPASTDRGRREVDPADGRYAFRHGDGALVASVRLSLVDLGDLGPRETGAWTLSVQAGTIETVSANRVEIRAAPTVSGTIVLLDGSSLAFKGPLAITWEFPG